MSENFKPHESDPSVNSLTRWIIYIFVSLLIAIPVLLYFARHKVAPTVNFDWINQPCFAKDNADTAKCNTLKNELRAKYKLAAKKSELDEIEDNRVVVKQLEALLSSKKRDGLKLDNKKAPEAAMNNRMEIANLEYEIDKISDFVPEIKARKEKERSDESLVDYHPYKEFHINERNYWNRPK